MSFQFFHTQKSNLYTWTDSLHVILLPTSSKTRHTKSILVSAGKLEAKKNWFSWAGLAWDASEIICLPSRHCLNTQRHSFVISAALSLQNASSLHDGATWPAGWECACLLPCTCYLLGRKKTVCGEAKHQDCSDIAGRHVAELWSLCPNGPGWHKLSFRDVHGRSKNWLLKEQFQFLEAHMRGTNTTWTVINVLLRATGWQASLEN